MNTNGFKFAFGFAVLSILSRMAFLWLKKLSFKTAGKTLREVEKHYDEVKRNVITYEKEIAWLSRVSHRPMLTKVLYITYYVMCSLGLVGLVLSFLDFFIPQLDFILDKALFALMTLCMLSALIGAIVKSVIGNKY